MSLQSLSSISLLSQKLTISAAISLGLVIGTTSFLYCHNLYQKLRVTITSNNSGNGENLKNKIDVKNDMKCKNNQHIPMQQYRLRQRIRWRLRKKQRQLQNQQRYLLLQILQQQQQQTNKLKNRKSEVTVMKQKDPNRSWSSENSSSSQSRRERMLNDKRRQNATNIVKRFETNPIEDLYIQWRLQDRLSYKNLSSIGMLDQSSSSSTRSTDKEQLHLAEIEHIAVTNTSDNGGDDVESIKQKQTCTVNDFNSNPSNRRSSKNYDHFEMEIPDEKEGFRRKTNNNSSATIDNPRNGDLPPIPKLVSKCNTTVKASTLGNQPTTPQSSNQQLSYPPRQSPKTNTNRKRRTINRRGSPISHVKRVYAKNHNNSSSIHIHKTFDPVQVSSISTTVLSPASSFERLLLEGEDVAKDHSDESDDDESDTLASVFIDDDLHHEKIYESVLESAFPAPDSISKNCQQPNKSLSVIDTKFWFPSDSKDEVHEFTKTTSNASFDDIIPRLRRNNNNANFTRTKISSSRSWRSSGALSTCLSPHVAVSSNKEVLTRHSVFSDSTFPTLTSCRNFGQQQNTLREAVKQTIVSTDTLERKPSLNPENVRSVVLPVMSAGEELNASIQSQIQKPILDDQMRANSLSIGPGIQHISKRPPSYLLQMKRHDSEANLSSLKSARKWRRSDSGIVKTNEGDVGSFADAGLKDPDQIKRRSRVARAKYNAQIMPNRIILIRHGQSMGNVDEGLYSSTPDNAMPLTDLGWEQAKEAGWFLRQLLSNQKVSKSNNVFGESSFGSGTSCSGSVGADAQNDDDTSGVHFILSPYVRTVETFHGIVSAWCDPKSLNEKSSNGLSDDEVHDKKTHDQVLATWYNKLVEENGITWQEDPRIREQDFGNYQDPKLIQKAKKDRHRFGAFYYRFPNGESASDVFDRVSTFLDSLWRSFDTNKSRNYVLVTHGISIRVILARYFRYTVDQFHLLANPRNCEMIVLEHDGAGRLQLAGRYELDNTPIPRNLKSCMDTKPYSGNDIPVDETKTKPLFRYHKRLRVLPRRMVREVKIRMSHDDER